ncbi:membrane-spanning 4-domains subfamily A member 13 isoform X2 [Marmota monax]|uniref:membrane-spanning 4-domains subfamily A member 13 isoform X2 n=1 Tax=Marmota monax TaxID=9995 RepID=UPI001EB09848|nr:membrane-spanning 4-domains subfamily A member 13 isoform X2 [Marmota monax]
MACGNTSTADSLVLGAIQIMIGIFHIFMWYFLLVLYMGQIKGVFGTYEPITYKTGCAFWGIFYIVSGASTIRSTQKSSQYLTIWALIMNIFSVITAFIALCLTVLELSTFHTVSYRNYGQAKLGREVSRILLASYLLEIGIALAHSICCCAQLFVFSGTFAVVVEKKRSKFLLSYAIGVNILSACISIIGITLLLFELTLFGTVSSNSPWSRRSGALLSTYLFLFSILEFCLAVIVTDWGYKANR